MLLYILRRIIAAIPVVGVVALFVFSLLHLAPGDPAVIIAGNSASAEQLASIRESMGLNEPLWMQFLTWLGHLATGDLGTSLYTSLPVTEVIGSRVATTLSLAVVTIILSLLLAIPMGVLAAWTRGQSIDKAVMAIAVIGFSVPVFVVGYVLIYLFSIKLNWFPVQGFVHFTEDPLGFLRSVTLPAVTLALFYLALVSRITRSSLLETLGEDFIRTARAKGATEKRVLLRHALRNAAAPILTVTSAALAYLIGGVVVTESVFNLPGMGRLVVEAVLARDYPLIQGLILVLSLVYIGVNLITDILYSSFDPRIRY